MPTCAASCASSWIVSSPETGRGLAPFECHWQASRQWRRLHSLVVALALVSLLACQIAWPLQLLGLPLLGVLAWRSRHPAGRWRGLRHDGHGWSLDAADGSWKPVQLLPDSLVTRAFICLHVRIPGRFRREALLIPADALPAEQHRRLRVRLRFSRGRWQAPAAATACPAPGAGCPDNPACSAGRVTPCAASRNG